MTTALMRQIERDDEAKRQELWADRRAGVKRRTKWAVDHLLDTGQITADQHTAAVRYAQAYATATERQFLGGSRLVAIQTAWDTSFAVELKRMEDIWGREEARGVVSGMKSWVQAAPRTNKARMRLMARLFALPSPSWKVVNNGNGHSDKMAVRISSLLDVMIAFWDDRDAAYGCPR